MPTHGYEATREAAMVAFAKSWRREIRLKKSGLRRIAAPTTEIVGPALPIVLGPFRSSGDLARARQRARERALPRRRGREPASAGDWGKGTQETMI